VVVWRECCLLGIAAGPVLVSRRTQLGFPGTSVHTCGRGGERAGRFIAVFATSALWIGMVSGGKKGEKGKNTNHDFRRGLFSWRTGWSHFLVPPGFPPSDTPSLSQNEPAHIPREGRGTCGLGSAVGSGLWP